MSGAGVAPFKACVIHRGVSARRLLPARAPPAPGGPSGCTVGLMQPVDGVPAVDAENLRESARSSQHCASRPARHSTTTHFRSPK
jgi:hypothetical protein